MPLLPDSFHPLITSWFGERYGKPTAIQAEAWELIEQRKHVLALAPTGSGKTLTAFLSAISRFCPAADNTPPEYPADKLTVLYVSPLKALNEDIRRNLIEPLTAIQSRFEQAGIAFPAIRVETRSGDTPQTQRRRFLAHPPSILALTPESLAILLLNPKGRLALSTVKYLILDEIHAVLGNKRGAYLACQIDRLALIAGEFQRISLSATVRPPEAAAEFAGGIDLRGRHRNVYIAAPASEKQIELSIEYCDEEQEIERIGKYGKRYTALINYILSRINTGSTILVFVDSRRRAERLCYFINQEAALQETALQEAALQENITHNGTYAAFAHHGSLSKELRHSVEQRLAKGELPCVVATASLELGIDIGSVDEVILAGSPASVSQALQRIGRSGHGVGKISRGRLFPFHGLDLLLGMALKNAVDDRDIEEIHAIENPLDILAQIILSLCVERAWHIDELYTTLKHFYIFRNLNHESYIRTVYMLAGRFSGEDQTRMREIKPRIWLDAASEEIGALEGTLLLLYASGGVIANRGLYALRTEDGTKIGELDEEFVWERRIGDRFYFGGRGWRILNIGTEAVEVCPLSALTDFIPFWHADSAFRSPRLSERVLAVLDHPPAENAALTAFLDSQRAAQNGMPLSCSANITVEIINSQAQGELFQAVIHTFRGGMVNYPLALALRGELEETLEARVESFSNDDAILLLLPRRGIPEDIIRRALVSLNGSGGGNLSRGERLFRNRLEVSGVFGAHFREAAERSLLLPRAGFGKRTPLWISRQRSKQLFDAASDKDGFPITAEAWRSCLQDMFDMEGFRDLLSAINSGSIALSFFETNAPSPFSREMVRQETGSLMYEYDERTNSNSRSASLSDRVIEEALGNAALRPVLPQELVNNFTARLRREIAGWAPDDALSLCEWVKERIAIPLDEWETLCTALPGELQRALDQPYITERLTKITLAGTASIVHREWETSWNDEALTLLGPWLRYEGPVSLSRIAAVFGIDFSRAEDAVNALAEVEEIARDVTLNENDEQLLVCDRKNLEMLLRLSRRKARPEIKERPAALITPFLALRQGLGGSTADTAFLKKLAAWPAQAKLWETEFGTARTNNYQPEIIDREIREGRMVWYGKGKERISLCPLDDLDLAFSDTEQPPESDASSYAETFSSLLQSGFFDRPRGFWEIKDALAANSSGCAAVLWHNVWQGRLSSDSLEPVRRGLESGFAVKDSPALEAAPPGGCPPRLPRVPRALKNRWKGGAPVRGNWFSLAIDEAAAHTEPDPFDVECRDRDRVRLLLARWGVLCRPLLEREDAPFSWRSLLPAMRRMELSGELIAGRFFAGINSLQFASAAIARELENAEAHNGVYWMNAADPASPAGLEIDKLDPHIPARLASNRLYFRGAQLIAVSNKNGKDLYIGIDTADSAVSTLIELIKIPRLRSVLPEHKITVETINGDQAADSAYASVFQGLGFISDRGKLCFW